MDTLLQEAIDSLQQKGFVKEAKKLGFPPTFAAAKGGDTSHEIWRGVTRAARKALDGITIGGEKHDGGPDPIQFIKKFDPSNLGGSVKGALDIMEKLRDEALTNSLLTSIQPLQKILGGEAFSAMQKAGSSAKAARKIQNRKRQETPLETPDVIQLLIAAAMDTLTIEDHMLTSELLDDIEIEAISTAFYGNGIYISAVEVPAFVLAINQLIPQFRLLYGAAK